MSVADAGFAPDVRAAEEFLADLDQIHLAAIPQEGGAITCHLFEDVAKAVGWAAECNVTGQNIYWTVNQVKPWAHARKPAKKDIAAARFAHVDIDPPKDGSDFDRAGALASLEGCASPPSFVIDSGGGLQAFWRLEEPCENWVSVEAINDQLRHAFGGGDACHNIDRLMRVPGFINWPGKVKRERGQEPRLARIAAPDDGCIFEPIGLAAAFPPVTGKAHSAPIGILRVALPGAIERLTPDSIGLWADHPLRKDLAIEGIDRSQHGFRVIRDAVRWMLPDEVIFGLMLNPDMPAAAHFVEKAGVRGVRRCIAKARTEFDIPSPAELFVVDVPGSIRALRGSFVNAHPPVAALSPVEPVDLWAAFAPPALPIGLLPSVIEEWAHVNGVMMGCDPAGLAVAALVTCATAISDTIKLKVKRHEEWTERACIWAALVGSPSTKKSPMLSVATSPLCRLDTELMRDWQRRAAEWNAQSADEKKAAPCPPQTRLRIEDTTVEAAQEVLKGSPWGIMLLQDELSGFFGSMDKYGGGKGAQADRAFWLRTFNGGEYAINRVGRGAGVIPNNSISILGGIQPEPLRKIAGEAVDDGLLQRLFPIVLRPATMGRDEPAPPVNARYRDLVGALRQMVPPGLAGSGILSFSDEAQAIRSEHEARHLELQSLESINRKLAAHIGKYDGLFARLCIVWHCIEHAGNPSGLSPIVEAQTARRVGKFLHQFLLGHSVAFYAGILGLSDDHDRLTAIAGHILAQRLDRVTNRDVQRGDRTMRGLRDFEIRPLLEQLEAMGWLDRAEGPRPSSPPHFKVNPLVHQRFTEKAKAESERRALARAAIAEIVRP